ncbi:MAG: radical SAM protein [bacterium]
MEKEVNNVLRISITNKCNFNCIYCPDYMEVFEPVPDNSIELTNDEIIKIVQDVTSLGIKKVSLT